MFAKELWQFFVQVSKGSQDKLEEHNERMKVNCLNVFEQNVVDLRLTFKADYCMIL